MLLFGKPTDRGDFIIWKTYWTYAVRVRVIEWPRHDLSPRLIEPEASFSPVLVLITDNGHIRIHEDGIELVVELLCGVFGDDLRCGARGVIGVLGRRHVGSVIGLAAAPISADILFKSKRLRITEKDTDPRQTTCTVFSFWNIGNSTNSTRFRVLWLIDSRTLN